MIYRSLIGDYFKALFYFAAPASSPVNVAVTFRSPTSVLVTWEAPPIEDRNGMIDEYSVELEEVATGRQWTRTAIGMTRFLFDFLEESYDYRVRVAAVTTSMGPFSAFRPFTTQADGKQVLESSMQTLELVFTLIVQCLMKPH